MKRKIYAILIASIILGAGAVVATGTVSDIEFPLFASVIKAKKNTETISAEKFVEYKNIETEISRDAVELKEQCNQHHKEKYLTAEKKSLIQKVFGQWGYMGSPRSQGNIIGSYNGRTIKGSFTNTETRTIDFNVDLARGSFTGNIYIRQQSLSVSDESNIQAVAVVPIYGVYSISNGYITAFWSKGVCEPVLTSTLDQVYDGWFFGEFI